MPANTASRHGGGAGIRPGVDLDDVDTWPSSTGAKHDEELFRSMFHYTRMKRWGEYPAWVVPLCVLWLPFGVVLGQLRFWTAWFAFGFTRHCPHVLLRHILRPMQRIWGFTSEVVNKSGVPLDELDPQIVVANHCTDYDPIPCEFALRRTVHVLAKVNLFHDCLYDWLNIVRVKKDVDGSKSTTRKNIQRHFARNTGSPIFLCPEGGITNGTQGLLMFNKYMFSHGASILPCVLTYEVPWPIHHDRLGTELYINLLYNFFFPYMKWRVTVLPLQHIQKGESAKDFAYRIEAMIARELNVTPTLYNYADKCNLRKELYGA